MLPLLLTPLLIAVLLAFSARYILFRRLLGLALQQPSYELTAIDAAPADLRQLAAPTINQLEQLGFRWIGACKITPLIDPGEGPDWELLLAQNGSFAHIALRHPLEVYAPTKVTFYSFLQNEHLLLTLNGEAHGLIGPLPATTLSDAYTADLAQQWRSHCQLIETAIAPRQALPPEAYLQQLTHHFNRYLQQLLQQQQIQAVVPAAPTEAAQHQRFQLSQLTALISAWKISAQGGKAAALAKALAQSPGPSALAQATAIAEPLNLATDLTVDLATNLPANSLSLAPISSPALPITAQVKSFQRMQCLERGSLQRGGDRWLFLGSLALFALSFHQLFDGPGLVLFIGAVALHEAGHHWAMRYFGYENTAIFFLPFLGAAATGHKDKASLFEKVCVLLAGPLPGLLLGGLLQSQGNTLAREASTILIGLNLFNLLPLYPLDGGKIVHLLFFSRFPYWDVIFKLGAVFALGLLSFLSPFFIALAIIVGLSIPHSLRSAKITAALRQQTSPLPATDSPQYLQQILHHLQELGYHRLPFQQRYSLTKELWERRGETQSSWKTYLSLGLLYLFCLLGAPAGLLFAQSSKTLAPTLSRSLSGNLSQGISQTAPTPPAKLAIAQQR